MSVLTLWTSGGWAQQQQPPIGSSISLPQTNTGQQQSQAGTNAPSQEKVQPVKSPNGIADVSGVSITSGPEGELFVDVKTSQPTTYHVLQLSNPRRLVLDVDQARQAFHQKTFAAQSPLLSEVRVGQFKEKNPSVVRVVADLTGDPIFDVHSQAGGIRIALKARTSAAHVTKAGVSTTATATPVVKDEKTTPVVAETQTPKTDPVATSKQTEEVPAEHVVAQDIMAKLGSAVTNHSEFQSVLPPASGSNAVSASPSSSAPDQSTEAVQASNAANEGNQGAAPEVQPLSSGIMLEPGSRGSSATYFLPSFAWTGFLNRTISQTSALSGTITQSVYVGNIVAQRVRRHSQLNLDYAGGAEFYGNSYLNNTRALPPGWGTVQKLSFSAMLSSGHLKLILGDQGMYLPESSYGFAGFSGLQTFGGGSGGAFLGNQTQISQLLAPGESVLTGGSSRRYMNVLLAEAQYRLTERSTFTVTGTAGILHFLDSGFINSRTATLMAGYDYRLTRRDTISLTYIHFDLTFDQANQGILERGFLLGYGRQFNARLSMHLSAGPSQNEVAQPQGGNVKQVFWITNDSLRYRARFADFAANFTRYTSPGSGVSNGAETNLASLSAGRPIVGKLRGALQLGHAYNQSVRREASGERQSQYETWEAGVTLSREYGEHASLYAQYQFRYQINPNPTCFLGGCRIYSEQQRLGAGINWHGRPRIR